MALITIGSVSSEDFAGVLSGVLTVPPGTDCQFVAALADVSAAALNASITPGITPFKLEGAARGMAQLLHAARLTGDCRVYERVRTAAVQVAEPDRLLAEAYETTWPELRTAYSVPVASFATDPQDYKFVAVADLPPPWNLARHCPSSARYSELEKRNRRKQTGFWRKLTRSPANPALARAEAWGEFQDELRSGKQTPCALHDLKSSEHWQEALLIAGDLIASSRPWQMWRVYDDFRERRGVSEPLPPVERLAWSLIAEPITWAPGNNLSNGQHRLCGAVAAGVPDILVRIQR